MSNLDVDHDIAYTQCELDLCAVHDDDDLMKELASNHVADFVEICTSMGSDEPPGWRILMDIREYENRYIRLYN